MKAATRWRQVGDTLATRWRHVENRNYWFFCACLVPNFIKKFVLKVQSNVKTQSSNENDIPCQLR